jgi:hypothetical protein
LKALVIPSCIDFALEQLESTTSINVGHLEDELQITKFNSEVEELQIKLGFPENFNESNIEKFMLEG